MTNLRKQLLLIMGILLTITTYAQDPEFQYDFDGSVKWMTLHESGTLVASTTTILRILSNPK